MDRTDEDRAVAPEGNRWPPLSDNQLEAASMSRAPIVHRLIADLRVARAEVERMAETLWAICDGDGSPQDRIIAAGGLGDRYDHSKPHGR